jgi:hypothetical protein
MVAPTPCAHLEARRTVPKSVWSKVFGYDRSSLWLILTMNGMRWAQRRATAPRTPKVDATALQPPSMARRQMPSGSNISGWGANDAAAECSMP